MLGSRWPVNGAVAFAQALGVSELVIGLTLVAPAGLPAAAALLRFDLPVMIAVAFACLPIFASGATIARWEGALFLFYYAAYLVLAAQQHDALPVFSAVMEAFVMPLTGVTLAVVGWRAWRRPAA